MAARKLPHYSVLYHLIAVEGRSYPELAAAYGSSPPNICRQFRREVERNGGTWPVPRPKPVLPSWTEVHRRLTEGESYTKIAADYRVPKSTMECHIRALATNNGYEWPLLGWSYNRGTVRIGEQRRKDAWRRHYQEHHVDPAPLREVLVDFLRRNTDYSLQRIADESGATRSFVWGLHNPNRRNKLMNREKGLVVAEFLDRIDAKRGYFEEDVAS